MKTLFLMRHAKSSWDDPDLEDRERPLNSRGRNDAPAVAGWLRAAGLVPDGVVTSDAARAVETWETMAPLLPRTQAALRPELYHAGTSAILDIVRSTDDRVKRLLVIGHEPGIGHAACRLADDPLNPDCLAAFEHFPTAALAMLDVSDTGWADLGFRKARFISFTRPSDLAEKVA